MHIGPVSLNSIYAGTTDHRIAWVLSFRIPCFTIEVKLYTEERKFY